MLVIIGILPGQKGKSHSLEQQAGRPWTRWHFHLHPFASNLMKGGGTGFYRFPVWVRLKRNGARSTTSPSPWPPRTTLAAPDVLVLVAHQPIQRGFAVLEQLRRTTRGIGDRLQEESAKAGDTADGNARGVRPADL